MVTLCLCMIQRYNTNLENVRFHGENSCIVQLVVGHTSPLNFAKKNFADIQKIAKFVKASQLKASYIIPRLD